MPSLQEQLLKSGLVDEKKLAKAEQEKNKRASTARKQRGKRIAKPDPAKPQRLLTVRGRGYKLID